MLGRIARSERSGEQPPLAAVGAQRQKAIALSRGLYALRYGRQGQHLRHRDHGTDYHVVLAAPAQAGYERPIDLHFVEGKHAQVSQRE